MGSHFTFVHKAMITPAKKTRHTAALWVTSLSSDSIIDEHVGQAVLRNSIRSFGAFFVLCGYLH